MTAHEDYWLAMSHGARIVDLDRAESLRLLAAKKIGRLAFVNEGAPMIMPMNFTLADERIIFRTLAHGLGARAVDTPRSPSRSTTSTTSSKRAGVSWSAGLPSC